MTTKIKPNLQTLARGQAKILEELQVLRTKLQFLGSLRKFDELAKKGRGFAKKRGIKSQDVLQND
jgi:hypothetical protein